MSKEKQLQRIERAQDAFAYYGYIVASEPIEGYEEVYADSLWAGVRKIESTLGKRKGNRHMVALHAELPVPCWGVEVRASVQKRRSR